MKKTCSLYPADKLDNIFPNTQFQAEGYKLFYMDRNKIRAWDYLKENFPRKIINSHKFPGVIEIICFEFSISNKKCLLLRKYRHPSQYDEFFLNELK